MIHLLSRSSFQMCRCECKQFGWTQNSPQRSLCLGPFLDKCECTFKTWSEMENENGRECFEDTSVTIKVMGGSP